MNEGRSGAARERLAELFEQAMAMTPEARVAFLAETCRGDTALHAELTSLLASHAAAPDFFEQLAAHVLPTALVAISQENIPTGQLVGRYEVLENLGGGGMGVVYKARDPALDRLVALKFLPPHLTADTEARARLKREARIASALDHPNIAIVHEIGMTEPTPGDPQGGRLFIAMAFYEGETLRSKIARGPLPIHEVLDYASQLAEGLSRAHEAGIVHRDIKPANLMVTDRGQLKILDFGVARGADTELTREGTKSGTLAYMSPEQTRGDAADQRTDLWSAGVVLYEMIAGLRPFRGEEEAVVVGIRNDDPEALELLRPDVPPVLARAVERCLAKDPRLRYQNAADLVADLRGQDHQPVNRARPRTIAIGVAGVVAVSGLIATWGLLGRSGPNLDPDTFVILPFRVAADPSLGSLREGMVDLFAAALNGDTATRAVDPRTTLASWRRAVGNDAVDPSPDDAFKVARSLGAGRLVMGEVIRTAARLTLNVTMYDVARADVLHRISQIGAPDSLPMLVDQLIAQLLARDAGLPQHQLAALTTRSLPALRAYLDGRRSYRLGHFGEAARQLEDAMQQDSTFALAAIQLWLVSQWGYLTTEPGTGGRALRLAWAARDRLSAPDRLFLEAIAGPNYPEETPRDAMRVVLERAVDATPDRPEALLLLGNWHSNGMVRDEPGAQERGAEYYRRAIGLDSTYAAPISNLLRSAVPSGDTATVRQLVQRYLRTDSTSEAADLFRWTNAAASGDKRAIIEVRRRMPSMHPTALGWIALHAIYYGIDLDGAEAALDALRRGARSQRDRFHMFLPEREFLGNRGRLDEMAARADSFHAAESAPLVERLARKALNRVEVEVWAEDAKGLTAAALLLDTAHRKLPVMSGAPGDINFLAMQTACASGYARLRQRQFLAAATAAARLREIRRILVDTLSLTRYGPALAFMVHSTAVACAATLDAAIAAEEERPNARALAQIADTLLIGLPRFPRNVFGLMLAGAYDALGDPSAGLRVLRRRELDGPAFFLASILREEGRLAARVGDREGAIRAYRHYLAMRTQPDPALQAEVRRVREELAALVAGDTTAARPRE
jgi:serine/threonine-protein kinase